MIYISGITCVLMQLAVLTIMYLRFSHVDICRPDSLILIVLLWGKNNFIHSLMARQLRSFQFFEICRHCTVLF